MSKLKKNALPKNSPFAVTQATKITVNGEQAVFWRFYAQFFGAWGLSTGVHNEKSRSLKRLCGSHLLRANKRTRWTGEPSVPMSEHSRVLSHSLLWNWSGSHVAASIVPFFFFFFLSQLPLTSAQVNVLVSLLTYLFAITKGIENVPGIRHIFHLSAAAFTDLTSQQPEKACPPRRFCQGHMKHN